MAADPRARLAAALERRYGDAEDIARAAPVDALGQLARMADRRVIRAYQDRPVDPDLVRLVAATALAAPSKSDLQQRDIVIVTESARRLELVALCGDDAWMRVAPVFVVFLGNHRRQRQLHAWRGKPFANDHLDPFFNASVDAAIVLGWFVAVAEAVGLGCCPISQLRNHPRRVSEILNLPKHVVPVAGLTLGWPANDGVLAARLPLAATIHAERFDDSHERERVEGYDRRRNAMQRFRRQRDVERWGESSDYGWSEDKARQYARSERADFGAYVREQGFKLD
jgi:nitroreductase/FMN reductase [NAD(P)H]